MQSEFPLEMIRPLLKNNPCFGPMIRTFFAILRFFLLRIIYFSLNIFLIEKKVESYIFRYNKLKNIRFYIFIFCFYMLFERLMVVFERFEGKNDHPYGW